MQLKLNDCEDGCCSKVQHGCTLSVVSGLVGVFSLYLVFGYGADLIVTILGFAYPAYQS